MKKKKKKENSDGDNEKSYFSGIIESTEIFTRITEIEGKILSISGFTTMLQWRQFKINYLTLII